MNKSLFSLPLILLVFVLATGMARPTPRKAMVAGDVTPIWDVSDPKVQSMGAYAVSEYDKTTTDHLEFVRVVNGSTIDLSYYPSSQRIWFLFVEAKICKQYGKSKIYYTQVSEMHESCPTFAPPGSDCNRDYLAFQGLGDPPKF